MARRPRGNRTTTDSRHLDDGLSIAEGPNGEAVEFTVLAKPLGLGGEAPYALIAIYRIDG